MTIGFRPTKNIAPGVRLNLGQKTNPEAFSAAPEAVSVPPEPGTRPPTHWAAVTAGLALLAACGVPVALPLAAIGAWVTWRGYRAPAYVALKRIRAAGSRVEADARMAETADEAVGAAAAHAPDSWTVQRAAARYFASRGDPTVALQHFANAIRLWPGERRAILLEACQLAIENGQYTWVIENMEPYAASLRPERSDTDARLLAFFALAHVGVEQAPIALELTKRLPLHRRDLTPTLLFGLCVRALAKHASGQRAAAKHDLARVYAADPEFPFLKTVQELINEDSTA